MPDLNKPTIGIFTSVEGHLSIAQTIQQTLADKYQIELYLERDDTFDFYVPLYKFFPGFFSIPFHLARQTKIIKVLNQYFKRKYQRKLSYFYRKYEPKLFVSTYFMYNSSLQDLAAKHRIPFINILTDPRTFHPMTIAEQAETNIAFDTNACELCDKYFPKAKVQSMGWFVREEYEQSYDQNEVRQQLNLKPKTLTILLTSGSEGTNIVATILPTLLNSQRPIQLIVSCGNNKTLYRAIKTLAKHLPVTKERVSILALPFTDKLHQYMQASDLIVGKAGPNTLFEATATLTPFFAITHISGQEDGNLSIIRDYKLGYVEENMFKANKLLRKIIRNPEQLQEFQPALKKMATYNADAKKEFKKLVHHLLPTN